MTEKQQCQLELEYPCEWQYKAIGKDKEKVEEAVEGIFQGHESIIQYSHGSRTGKFHSFSIDLVVANEEERLGFYEALKKNPQIMIVI